MKARNVIGLKCVLLMIVLCGAFLLVKSAGLAKVGAISSAVKPSIPVPSPFPDASIPGVPSSSTCCLWQLEKSVTGNRQATFGNSYTCDMGPHRRGDLTLKMTLNSTGPTCDQNDNIPDGSVFEAQGSIIRRHDGFAFFGGEFTVTSPAAEVLYKGRIETTDRLGSHHLAKCEAAIQSHMSRVGSSGEAQNILHELFDPRFYRSARHCTQSYAAEHHADGSLSGTYIKCL